MWQNTKYYMAKYIIYICDKVAKDFTASFEINGLARKLTPNALK